jgi:hypothetical protein
VRSIDARRRPFRISSVERRIAYRSRNAALLLTARPLGFLVRFLRGLKRHVRVLHGLLREFVARQMIFFAVMHGSRSVRMCRQFVKLRCPLMKTLWHKSSLSQQSDLTAPTFVSCY